MRKRRKPQEQVAFDAGMGRRGISHDRQNPFDAVEQADLHAAWNEGWDYQAARAERIPS